MFRAFIGYGEQLCIQARCRGKSGDISKADKKYPSGCRKKAGGERNEKSEQLKGIKQRDKMEYRKKSFNRKRETMS